jgi:hypothetical protein
MLYTLATGIGPTVTNNVGSGQVLNYEDNDGPAVNVDSILTSGTTANVVNVTLLPGSVGVYAVEFQLNSGLAANPLTQLTIAQQAFVSNVVTFPVVPGPAYLLNATSSSTSATAASATPVGRRVISVPAGATLSRPKSGNGPDVRGTSSSFRGRSSN